MICKQCGREFHAKPSAIAKGKKYCSKSCYDAAQFKGVYKTCYGCGKLVKISPSLVREKNFCSNDCRLNWLKEHVRTEININGHSKGHKAPHLSELNKERNPKLALEPDAAKRGTYQAKKHRETMEKILGRKLKPCEDVHHINGIHDDNRPENLAVMKHSDHLRLHWRIAKEKGVV